LPEVKLKLAKVTSAASAVSDPAIFWCVHFIPCAAL